MKFSSAAILLLGVTESAHAFSVVTTPPTTSSRIVVRQQGSYSSTTKLYGILDEIQGDDYQLGGGGGGDPSAPGGLDSAYEIFLGELVFSTNDPRMDIMNSPDQAFDPNFLTWMSNKAEKSQDPDERLALKDLYNMILDVKKTVELSAAAKEREAKEAEEKEAERIRVAEEEAAAGREMSNTDVLKKAAAIGSMKTDDGSDEEDTKVSFYDEELTPEIRLSYEDTLKKVLPPYKPGESPQSVVKTNYDQFDAQFIKVLSERASNGDDDSSILLDALAEEQNSRIAAATEHLKTVLAAGEPMRMEGVIVKLARDGKIDEPFLLLLEANETQARDAGATGPAELMKRLRLRAAEEKDKMVTSKEIRLIRKLLRADNSEQREKILEDAFTPRENLLVAGTAENAAKAIDGEVPEQEKPMPDVPPPDFINACKAVVLNFGNLKYDDERGDLASRIRQIASEAEVVATRIYGEGMSARDQQDRAWKDQTTSIFDLEQMELEAESRGEHAPWTNPDAPDDFIPGFDAEGKMRIGGD